MEDWYSVTQKDFLDNYGEGLLTKYGSVVKIIVKLYPDHPWEIWKFNCVGKHFWADKSNQLKFMLQLGEKLNFESMDDWYKITRADIIDSGGSRLLQIYRSSPARTVMSIFNQHKFLEWKFDVMNTEKY